MQVDGMIFITRELKGAEQRAMYLKIREIQSSGSQICSFSERPVENHTFCTCDMLNIM